MSEHNPTPTTVVEHPEQIAGYTYGTHEAATSPLTLDELEHLKATAGITAADERALREAAAVLAIRSTAPRANHASNAGSSTPAPGRWTSPGWTIRKRSACGTPGPRRT